MDEIEVTEEEIQEAYWQIAIEKGLTVMPVGAGGFANGRAYVPPHWREEATARARLDKQNRV